MIPKTLQGWTIEDVVRLAERGVYETDTFDFKETLPDSRNEKDKGRLVKTCAAFANSAGGFLVFGVKDDRSLPVDQRLAGIASSIDFPEHFGNFPSQCSPSVEWDFRNPPLSLASGQVLHVVYVPRSWKAPHACGGPDTGWIFPKRTNKGNEFMSYTEVQSMFLGYYEKRLKLQLLRAEIAQIADDARGMIVPTDRNDGTTYGLPTIELRVLETILSDTYSITQSSPELLDAMAKLRSTARIINNKVAVFRLEVALPMSNKPNLIKSHNDFIRPHCERIITLAGKALSLLDEILLRRRE